MGRIEKLPAAVVNRIAAGEVVERPASVVKELLENAIDAGPTRVDVAVEQGGIGLVRVTDDGCGIDSGELPLAVENHATSKLRSADDLAEVMTLGFRGEALASIGEVARLVIRSRTRESACGGSIEIDCGHVRSTAPCAAAVGTTVEVHQLFSKIPARRAFLRSPATEWAHTSEAFVRTALAHPGIALSLSHNGRRVHDLPATDAWLERIAGIHGGALADRLLPVRAEADGLAVDGWVGRPEDDMASTRLQHLFVNGRPFRDRSVLHAVQEAYRGLMLSGRQPVAFLRISVDPSHVDVNVHPAKIEVRFREPSKLHQLVLAALRTAFLSNDLSTAMRPPAERQEREGRPSVVNRDEASSGPAPWAARSAPGSPWPNRDGVASAARGTHVFDAKAAPDVQRTFQPEPSAERRLAVQMHNRYIVVEAQDGIEVIDQHALHERVLFAELRESLEGGTLEVQRLLVPETVEVSPTEAELLSSQSELLDRIGLHVEPFGAGGVVVTSRPALAGRTPASALIREVLGRLGSFDRRHPERLLEEILHSMACHAAIKAGDPLSRGEVDALVSKRHAVEDGHHCPHGRPTILRFSRQELDRQFRRT